LAATESVEALADYLYDLTGDVPLGEGGRDDPPEILIPRMLAQPSLKPFAPRIAAALAIGARSWAFEPPNEHRSFVAAQLFRAFSTPTVAIALAMRLLGPMRSMAALVGSGQFGDLFIEAILWSDTDPTVRNRLVDLAGHAGWGRYAIPIFYRLLKTDVTAVPLVIDSAMMAAFSLLNEGKDPRALYMVGFDAQMELADVASVLAMIDETQAEEFGRAFLGHSARFRFDPREFADDPVVAYAGLPRHKTSMFVDLKKKKTVEIDHAEAVVRGMIKSVHESPRTNALEGLRYKAMAS
jgi:hypothetical protein